MNDAIMLGKNLQTTMLGGHELNCWCERADVFNVGTKGDDGIGQRLRLTALFLQTKSMRKCSNSRHTDANGE